MPLACKLKLDATLPLSALPQAIAHAVSSGNGGATASAIAQAFAAGSGLAVAQAVGAAYAQVWCVQRVQYL